MGNNKSKTHALSTEDIESMYAARAAATTSGSKPISELPTENPGASSGPTKPDGEEGEAKTNASQDGGNPVNESRPPPNESVAVQRIAHALRDSIPHNTAVSAACHITVAMRAYRAKAFDAFELAVAELRKLSIMDVAKVVGIWVKTHPWETAALVVPLILLACTPAILGAVGFTAGGIAAGSLAAGIQALIGSVGAGSLFALCTSAMMGGGGGLIIFGGVWAFSAIALGATALWKRWTGANDGGDASDNTSGYRAIEGEDNGEDEEGTDGAKTMMKTK